MIKVKISYECEDEYKDIRNIIAFLDDYFARCKIKRPKAAGKYKKIYIELYQ